MDFWNLFKKTTTSSSPYDSLTWNQKLAAMNLMIVFGGSCSGLPHELDKINHIMSVEGREWEFLETKYILQALSSQT